MEKVNVAYMREEKFLVTLKGILEMSCYLNDQGKIFCYFKGYRRNFMLLL